MGLKPAFYKFSHVMFFLYVNAKNVWNNCLLVYFVRVWAIILPIVGVQVSPHILIPKNYHTTPQGRGKRRGRTAHQRTNVSGLHWGHMSYSLNSLKGVIWRII